MTVEKVGLLSIFHKKPKIDEFDDLRTSVYESLKLWREEIKIDEIAVIMNYTICMGNFGQYDIFIPRLQSIWVEALEKIKEYENWSIKRWDNGLKLSCMSKRVETQTTRWQTKLKNGEIE